MPGYERIRDKMINVQSDDTFSMKVSPDQWYRRAESFDTILGYSIFARRLELSLRASLELPTIEREGILAFLKDLSTAPTGFQPIKERIRTDLSLLLNNASIVDCGAGTGSLLGFIEWAHLPYPHNLVMIEPDNRYFTFLQQRIEGNVVTSTRDQLTVISDRHYRMDNGAEHINYVVEDRRTGNQSQIQLIHANGKEKNLPSSSSAESIIIVGVSAYYHSSEFREIIENMQETFQQGGGTIAFNTQAANDILLGRVNSAERITYKGIKMVHELIRSYSLTLHNFYGLSNIDSLPGKTKVIYNYGDEIVVALKK